MVCDNVGTSHTYASDVCYSRDHTLSYLTRGGPYPGEMRNYWGTGIATPLPRAAAAADTDATDTATAEDSDKAKLHPQVFLGGVYFCVDTDEEANTPLLRDTDNSVSESFQKLFVNILSVSASGTSYILSKFLFVIVETTIAISLGFDVALAFACGNIVLAPVEAATCAVLGAYTVRMSRSFHNGFLADMNQTLYDSVFTAVFMSGVSVALRYYLDVVLGALGVSPQIAFEARQLAWFSASAVPVELIYISLREYLSAQKRTDEDFCVKVFAMVAEILYFLVIIMFDTQPLNMYTLACLTIFGRLVLIVSFLFVIRDTLVYFADSCESFTQYDVRGALFSYRRWRTFLFEIPSAFVVVLSEEIIVQVAVLHAVLFVSPQAAVATAILLLFTCCLSSFYKGVAAATVMTAVRCKTPDAANRIVFLSFWVLIGACVVLTTLNFFAGDYIAEVVLTQGRLDLASFAPAIMPYVTIILFISCTTPLWTACATYLCTRGPLLITLAHFACFWFVSFPIIFFWGDTVDGIWCALVTCNWALCPISFTIFFYLMQEEKKTRARADVQLARKASSSAAAAAASAASAAVAETCVGYSIDDDVDDDI